MKLLSLFILIILSPILSFAQVAGMHTQVDLVSDVATVEPEQTFWLAVRLESQPKWHTYWQNPGEAGFATKVTWEDIPDGIELDNNFTWPAPVFYLQDGIVSHVYEGEVFLLIRAHAGKNLRTGEPLTFKAKIDWLECNDSGCWPGGGDATLTLHSVNNGTASKPSAYAGAIAQTVRDLPRMLPNAWESLARQIAPDTYEMTLKPLVDNTTIAHATGTADNSEQSSPEPSVNTPNRKVSPIHFFPFSDAVIAMETPAQQINRSDDGTITWIVKTSESAATPEVIAGIFTADNSWSNDSNVHSLLVQAVVTPNANALPQAELSLKLVTLGFIGGLILNLMPCVFPVLGIKVLGFVQQAGSDKRKIVFHGLSFTAGVLISFWILSGVLIALRLGGAELGWGFQLQSPAFVAGLSVLLLVFGLSLSGLFDIGYSAMNVGSNLAAKNGFRGSFFSGVLATVVATPCAAPFLAPALGAALTLTPASSLIVFTAIAIGLSFPYLILSAFPSLIGLLPKPGPWMETFKQAMAFLLYATVAYLIWALAGLIKEEWFLNLLIGLVAIAAACWAYGRWLKPGTSTPIRGWLWTISLAAIGGWLIFVPVRPLEWENWSPERVAELQAQGRPVYVDFTARWCATCQVNKRMVFSSEEVLERFKKDRVAILKADWTDRNPAITNELAQYNRSAVPFNLFYAGKSGAKPVVLPEVLTPGIVLEALNQITSDTKQ